MTLIATKKLRIYHRKLEGALTWAASLSQRSGKLGTFPSTHHAREIDPDVRLDVLYKNVS